jgi:hypothetical protein
MVSVLALAGLGISYAGFTDAISVYGTVDTATVQIDWIGWYSGTWVYKVWGDEEPNQMPPIVFEGATMEYDWDNEILIYRGFTQYVPTEAQVEAWATNNGIDAELEAYSYAKTGTTAYPDPDVQATYDVDMVYYDLVPCIDFEADFIFHYGGSIPAKINVAEIFPFDGGSVYPGTNTNFLEWLWAYNQQGNDGYGAWVEAYRATKVVDGTGAIIGWDINLEAPVDVGTQLHNCDYVYVKLVIHLPQDNTLQGLSGTLGGTIGVIQWYDPCPP